MTEVILQLSSGSYSGYESISIDIGAQKVVRTFTAVVTNKTPSLFASMLTIRPGGAVTVIADGETILTGYVEKVDIDLSATEHSISISGSSKTADVVDCSCDHPSGQFKQLSVGSIASQLLKPMGIGVSVEFDGPPIPNYRLEDGETNFEAIVRAAHRDGVMVTDDAMGNLVLTEGGMGGYQGSLEEGVHFTGAKASFNTTQAFSEYRVKGQSSLIDENWARGAVDILGVALSDTPARRRVLITHDHTDTDRATVRKRALWEAQRRAGKVTSCSCSVPSWTSAVGGIWKPNATVTFKSPTLGVEQLMMIVSANLKVDNKEGTQAELTFQPPSAFKAAASNTGSRNSKTDLSKASPVTPTPNVESGAATTGFTLPDLTPVGPNRGL